MLLGSSEHLERIRQETANDATDCSSGDSLEWHVRQSVFHSVVEADHPKHANGIPEWEQGSQQIKG